MGTRMKEGSRIELAIAYTAKPRHVFSFVTHDKHYPDKHLEAWTQGEATQAKYWFPCIDHPQVKFTSEISVTVQSGFTAISNGRLHKVEQRGKKQVYHWSESNPHPAYLASIVVRKYAAIKERSLQYYAPPERKQDEPRPCDHTREMD